MTMFDKDARGLWAAASLVLAFGCSAGTGPVVVVQETNVRTAEPIEPSPCDGLEYVESTTLLCTSAPVTVRVCSEDPLCEAQLEQLVARVAECSYVDGDTAWLDAPCD